MDDFARIRQLHRDGPSARRIAEQLGVGRDAIRKALAHAEPTPYARTVPRVAPVFGPFAAVAGAILEADRTAPRKPRPTASQIFRRLVKGRDYTGGCDRVRRHLTSRRRAARGAFGPPTTRPATGARPTSATSASTSPTAAASSPCW